MPSSRPTYSLLRTCRCLLTALALLAAAGPAAAQVGLPGLPRLPGGSLSNLGDASLRDRLRERLLDTAELPRKVSLEQMRLLTVRDLLQRHPAQLEPDPAGFPVVRREILAWSPSAAGLAAASAAGLLVADRQQMPEVGQTLVTLRVPDGVATADALSTLRTADPDGVYDFDHIYIGAGSRAADAAPEGAPAAGKASLPASGAGAPGAVGGEVRVGLVDSGVDGGHEVFENARIVRWGCGDVAHPAAHGTAVGALMIGKSERFSGAAPGAKLYAADIYCDQPTGGSASQIVQALAWLAKEQVGVINISLVGPPNQMLGRVVQAMVARGHLLVAAVGNDGPTAPPLYPASYPGVVGVTGVDPKRNPLPEAARGPQVMFAAPGSQMAAAAIGAPPYKLVRGTSFASPLVAALLAPKLAAPSPAQAAAAVSSLAASATAAGDGTGRGVVGENLRIPPSAFR
ncbi:S8 family serine peptidase [Pseudoduganella eburnea]|uniref:S8 family serine peptidase n=1 Tax=Massilia eburnea TaxID=1776165 RepID=A0A6L6QN77_9BURK|nr:S8 family serine peptidase [Massilia eburnea]MTW13524.1 S8 family serine peptidase [Massilia eburnea]